jgi:hypothetical protein
MYSVKENGMELRACKPGLRPEDCVPALQNLSLPKPDAISFGFLEGVHEPWLGAEPSMSNSVLW